MKKEIKANHRFERVEISRARRSTLGEGAAGRAFRRAEPSKFKLDIIENIPDGEAITLYRNGEFTDLCAGPHVSHTGRIGAFKLTHVASAYYKGDERNRSSSAFTAPPSRTRPILTLTSPCWRKPESATIASLDARWSSSASMTTLVPVCPSGFRRARS